MANTSTNPAKAARPPRKQRFMSNAQIQAYLLAREAVRRACNAAWSGRKATQEGAR
ncbi:hypothetical protein GCM10007918_28410 [Piscinibacter gummiphilus]|nr:hypothetical protein GCM10007918_28410 [Piscinibacter gummiphilus]